MSLFSWIGKIFRKTHEAYCVRCKAKTRSVLVNRVKTQNSKGPQTRVNGICVDCQSKTSIISASA